MAQARLLGDAVDELAGLAVLVAGRQLQRGYLLGGVLVQHQAFVHHHGRREAVLWVVGGSGVGVEKMNVSQRRRERKRGPPPRGRFISKNPGSFS